MSAAVVTVTSLEIVSKKHVLCALSLCLCSFHLLLIPVRKRIYESVCVIPRSDVTRSLSCRPDRVLDWPWGAGREKVHCLGRHSECTPAVVAYPLLQQARCGQSFKYWFVAESAGTRASSSNCGSTTLYPLLWRTASEREWSFLTVGYTVGQCGLGQIWVIAITLLWHRVHRHTHTHTLCVLAHSVLFCRYVEAAAALTCVVSICWTSLRCSVCDLLRCPLRLKEKWGIKESRISNSCPALVCPPGSSSLPPAPSHRWAGRRSRVCFLPVSLVCYWAGQPCQMSLLWCVERPLTDSVASPSCHRQSIASSSCLSDLGIIKIMTAVCVLPVCLTICLPWQDRTSTCTL